MLTLVLLSNLFIISAPILGSFLKFNTVETLVTCPSIFFSINLSLTADSTKVNSLASTYPLKPLWVITSTVFPFIFNICNIVNGFA